MKLWWALQSDVLPRMSEDFQVFTHENIFFHPFLTKLFMEKVLLRKLLLSFSWYMYVELTSPQSEMSPSEELYCFFGGKALDST